MVLSSYIEIVTTCCQFFIARVPGRGGSDLCGETRATVQEERLFVLATSLDMEIGISWIGELL